MAANVCICIVNQARKFQNSPSPKVRVAQGGVGSSKHEKHHSNVYRSSQVITLYLVSSNASSLPLVRKKREIVPLYLDVVVFTLNDEAVFCLHAKKPLHSGSYEHA